VIETERLLLRPFGREDYEPYFTMVSEPDVPWRPTMSAEDAWHRVVRYVGHWTLFGYGNFAVLDRTSGLFLGETGLWDAHRGMGAAYDGCDEAGWSLVSRWQGHGIAFEAAEAAHRWYADAIGKRRTVCMTDPANERSIAVARKLGYTPFGTGAYRDNPVIMFERAS
jgi:RimJ/RimL family protein N-acetyltransferase